LQPAFELVERLVVLCQKEAGAQSLSDVWEMRVECGKILWRRRQEEALLDSACTSSPPLEIAVPGMTVAAELGVCLNVVSFESQANAGLQFPPANGYEALVDLSLIGKLYLRRRAPGDRIQPFGMTQPVRLKKFLHTHKSSAQGLNALVQAADATIVLADASEVLWVPGFGISEKLRVKDKPTHSLQFSRLSR
jgi:hypothetical protein